LKRSFKEGKAIEKRTLFWDRSNGKISLPKIYYQHARVLNADRMIVGKENGKLCLYRTRWQGEMATLAPHIAPLEVASFLNRSRHNKIEKVNKPEA